MDGDANADGGTGTADGGNGTGGGHDRGVAPAFEAKLHAGGVTFDAEDATLLRTVADAGSLNRATEELGRSYSRSHQRLEVLESAFGPLVTSQRGGETGGGSRLTDGAHDLLARFDRLRSEFEGVANVEETVLEGEVVDRDGELADVETDAGFLRAIAPPDAGAVRVPIRADAVTLHDADSAPLTSETSARNQFAGTVVDVDRGDALVRVAVDVGGDRPLVALVTDQSRRLLNLEPGREVHASFKTTATRATPRTGTPSTHDPGEPDSNR